MDSVAPGTPPGKAERPRLLQIHLPSIELFLYYGSVSEGNFEQSYWRGNEWRGATGSFVRGPNSEPAQGVIGNWDVHGDGYQATGVFAGSGNPTVPTRER